MCSNTITYTAKPSVFNDFVQLHRPTGFALSELVLKLARLAAGVCIDVTVVVNRESLHDRILDHGEFIMPHIAFTIEFVIADWRKINFTQAFFFIR